MDDIDSEVYIKYYRTLKEIGKDNQPRPEDLHSGTQVGYWYYGETGAGKSHAAYNEFPSHYRKIANNKWFDGYQGEPTIILDDFDKSFHYMGFHLKIWADRYAFVAESKGGSKMIRPKQCVITSNVAPWDIWADDATLQPILRRFKVVHFKTLKCKPRGQAIDSREETREPWNAHVEPSQDQSFYQEGDSILHLSMTP